MVISRGEGGNLRGAESISPDYLKDDDFGLWHHNEA
jgi:hypothetical protein